MSESVLNSFTRIYSHLPPLIQQFTYAHFKQIWKEHEVGYLMLSKSEDEPSDHFMQELYAGLTEQLASIPPPPSSSTTTATALGRQSDADGTNPHLGIASASTSGSSGAPGSSLSDSTNSFHARKRVAIFYMLYTLYHCQVSNRKHRIIIPQYLWTVLDDCAHEFQQLPIRDPIMILRDLFSRQQFEFTLAAAETNEEDSEFSSSSHHQRMKREGIQEELMEMKSNNEAQTDRPPKQRKLIDDSSFGEGAHEMFDLKSQLQLSKLREMSLAYAQAMHNYQDGVGDGKPTLSLSRTSSSANAAIGTASTSLPILQQLSLVHPTHSSLVPQSSTFSSGSFKLLNRVERAVEEQDGLRDVLRKQREAEAAAASFMPPSSAIPSSMPTQQQIASSSAAPIMRATQAVKAGASPFLAQPIAVDIHSVAAAAAAAQQHQ